jgi:hypothetical protein
MNIYEHSKQLSMFKKSLKIFNLNFYAYIWQEPG